MTEQARLPAPRPYQPQHDNPPQKIDFSIGAGFRFGIGFALASLLIYAVIMIPLLIIWVIVIGFVFAAEL